MNQLKACTLTVLLSNLIVNTPIEYRRINSIPEPSFTLGLLGRVIWGTGKARAGKLKQDRG